MCGIAGIHVKDPTVIKDHKGVELFVDALLAGIEHRGKHATGFVSVGFDRKVIIDKSDVPATEFIKTRDRIPSGVRTVLLHTRHATLGKPEQQENNHPVIYGSCFAVHNGHINNHADVFKAIDLTRSAEVDSQSIAAAVYYDGFGDIKTALERLEGGMATAIIDPVKNPGELILAKGKSSPLYVVNAEKFLVFASTKDCILKAWAKVFGTPPSDNKIEDLKDGTILLINDRTVTRSEFTPKNRPFISAAKPRGGTAVRTNGNGKNTGKNGRTLGSGVPIGPDDENAVTKAKGAISQYIAANGTARNWDEYHNGLYADEDFEDVLEDRQWHPCYGCDRLILLEDMHKTFQWGSICVDCKTATTRWLANNYKKATTDDTEELAFDTCAGTTIPRINEGDRDSLEIWAANELALHQDTLRQISKDCGSYYSPQAIEFLVFLTPPEYRASVGAAVNKLIDEFREAYEETSTQLLEDDHAAFLDSREAGGTPETWGFCDTHGTPYLEDEGCEVCVSEENFAEQERAAILGDSSSVAAEQTVVEGDSCGVEPFANDAIEPSETIGGQPDYERPYTRSSRAIEVGERSNEGGTTGGELIVLPKCETCGTHVLSRKGTCAVCEHVAATRANGTANEGTNGIRGICVTCSSPSTYSLTLGDKTFYYCSSDWSICSKLKMNEDKSYSLCRGETKHILSNGERVCHNHVRGQGGALSDTLLRRRGAVITELV